MTRQSAKTTGPLLIQDVQKPVPPKPPTVPERLRNLFRIRPEFLKSRKTVLILALVVALLIVSFVAFGAYRSKVPPIPVRFIQNAPVGLFHPEKLPKDMAFEPGETSTEKEAVITKFTDRTGKGSLYLTQQERPKGTDLKQIDAQETYLTDAGAVYILKGERERIQAIIETDDSWILLDSPTSIGITVVKELISNLKAQEPRD